MKNHKFLLANDFIIEFGEIFSESLVKKIKKEVGGNFFQNEQIYLDKDTLIIKSGFKWNGCSTKFRIQGVYYGLSDGSIMASGYEKLYHPSLMTIALYFNRCSLKTDTIDLMFYEYAVKNGFRCSFLYYFGLKTFGEIYFKILKIINKNGR